MEELSETEKVIDQLTGCGIPKSDIAWRVMFKTISKLENFKEMKLILMRSNKTDTKQRGIAFAKRALKTDNCMRVISHFIDFVEPIVRLQSFPSPSGEPISYASAMKKDETFEVLTGCTFMLSVLFESISCYKLDKLLCYFAFPAKILVLEGDSKPISPCSHSSCLTGAKSQACSIYRFVRSVSALLLDSQISYNIQLASACANILTETFLSLRMLDISVLLLDDRGFGEGLGLPNSICTVNETDNDESFLSRDKLESLVTDTFRFASSQITREVLVGDAEDTETAVNRALKKQSDLLGDANKKAQASQQGTSSSSKSLKSSAIAKVSSIMSKITAGRRGSSVKSKGDAGSVSDASGSMSKTYDCSQADQRLESGFYSSTNTKQLKREMKKTTVLIDSAYIMHSFLKFCCSICYVFEIDPTKYIKFLPNLNLFNTFKCKSLKKTSNKGFLKNQTILTTEEVKKKHRTIRMLKLQSYFLQLFFYYIIIHQLCESESSSEREEQKEDLEAHEGGSMERNNLILSPAPQTKDLPATKEGEEDANLRAEVQENVDKLLAEVNSEAKRRRDSCMNMEDRDQFIIIEVYRLVGKLTKWKRKGEIVVDTIFVSQFYELDKGAAHNNQTYADEVELFVLNVLFEMSQSRQITSISLFLNFKNPPPRGGLKDTQEISHKNLITNECVYNLAAANNSPCGAAGVMVMAQSIIIKGVIGVMKAWFAHPGSFVKNNREWDGYMKGLDCVELCSLLIGLTTLTNCTSEALNVSDSEAEWLITLPIYIYTVLKGNKIVVMGNDLKESGLAVSTDQKSRILNLSCDITNNFVSNHIKTLPKHIKKVLHELIPFETYSSMISYSFVGESEKGSTVVPSLALLKLSDSLQKYNIIESTQVCLGSSNILPITELLSYTPSAENLGTSSEIIFYISKYIIGVVNSPDSYNGLPISSVFSPIYRTPVRFTRLGGFCSPHYVVGVIVSLTQ